MNQLKVAEHGFSPMITINDSLKMSDCQSQPHRDETTGHHIALRVNYYI